jgi:hypothetical protein
MENPSFQASTDSKILASVLQESKPGDVVSYKALSAAIGRDVQSTAKPALDTARRIVQREKRMVFDAVRGEGLKRLTDSEIVDLADKTRDGVRRATRRTVKKMVCVDYEAMPKEKQTKHNTAISLFGVLSELATEKVQHRLGAEIERSGTELPVAKATIAALGLGK